MSDLHTEEVKTRGPSQRHRQATLVRLIAVGVDGSPEGRDATVLAAMIAGATGAELMLVSVHPDPILVLPSEMNWSGMEEQAEAFLRDVRDDVAPNARTVVETDSSVARALENVVRREHRDLLVVGSNRHAPDGHVRIGNRTRQLLGDARCALAVAPRGIGTRPQQRIETIGIGYDGGPESSDALARAGALALAAGAKLRVRAVVDDLVRGIGRREPQGRKPRKGDRSMYTALASLRDLAERAARATGSDAEVDVDFGDPVDALKQLSSEVDLLVIGSRRWGAVSRVLLGSTGEELMHDAGCAVMVVPRPARPRLSR